jgi:hypothetical protein
MNQEENKIVHILSAHAAEPDNSFANNLRQELIKRERKLSKKRKGFSMNFRKVSLALASVVLIAGVIVVITNRRENKNVEIAEDTSQAVDNQSTSQASSLPSQQAASLEEAKKSLSFIPMTPSIKLAGEELGNIKVGSKNGMIDDSDTIYLSYKNANGTLYKISESTKVYGYPAEVEKVEITVGGRKILASYHRLDGEGDSGDSPTSSGEQFASPRSYLLFEMEGVHYEISEFGKVSKDQLVELANSLQTKP